MEQYIFWIIVSCAMFVLEIFTAGFFVFWFGVAALAAMVVSFFTDNLVIQSVVFLVTSALLIAFTKPLVNKFLMRNTNNGETNVYTILGKKALVTTEINPLKSTGQIKIDSDVWSAKSSNGEMIPLGTQVVVEKIEGVKVIVSKVE